MTSGAGRWDAAAPVGEFTYLELKLDDIAGHLGGNHVTYNPAGGRGLHDHLRIAYLPSPNVD